MSILPKDPPPGLLVSMAIRYDHALGCPGYYDQPMFHESNLTHKDRFDSTIQVMKQLYEEVAGYGFYSEDRKQDYIKIENSISDPVKTTDEWLKETPGLIIMDPDGWDRTPGNFMNSWNEKITKKEFYRRLSVSTIKII